VKKRHTLEQKKPGKRAAFVLRPPNDNLEAYGWSLYRLRAPTADPEIAGRPVFNIPITIKEVSKYGVDLQFIDPRYLQYMLDQQPEIQKAVKKVKAAGYTPEALDRFKSVVVRVFEEHVLVDMVSRFFKAAPLVAQFYAAKLAHEDMFGVEEEEAEDEAEAATEDVQIEAKTTKSRR